MQVIRKPITDGYRLKIDSPKGPLEIQTSVPGAIHTDLIRAGHLRDIRIDGTEQEQEWIRYANSEYSAMLKRQEPGKNYQLRFNGLDTLAEIFINGALKLKTENMHRSYEIDVSNELSSGDLQLAIKFSAPLTEALVRQNEQGIYPNPYDMPYNYFRKMACSYGWDWGPITITSGIWKPIELIKWDAGVLDKVDLVADVIDQVPTLRVATVGRGEASRIAIEIKGKGDEKYQFNSKLNQTESFSLPGIALWHPRGFGDANLYSVEVKLIDNNDQVVDEFSKRVGFRSVTLDQSMNGTQQMMAICVNGQRVWARGVNWIPDDPFPHRVTRAQYLKKIKDLYSVEVNAIRVWGGGIYESDFFYEICDELGIIVWQDFLFACAAYPETQNMFNEVEAEAREAISRLASHPSLVMWCGGNECLEGFQHWGWQEPLDGKPWGLSFYKELLPSLLEQLDGTRPYIPGSPFSTLSNDVNDFSSGTNHIWDVWNGKGYQRYEEYSPAFAAEFGYNGPGSWRTLTKAIHKENLDSNDPDLATHQKAFDGMDKLAAGLVREFNKPFTAGPAWYFAAQTVQARAIEVGLKHFRSLYSTCSGSMLWQYNDMWPAISWSVLDSANSRKLSWYSMRESYRPRVLHFSTKSRELVVINDTDENWNGTLEVHQLSQKGQLIESRNVDQKLKPRSQVKISLKEIFGQAPDLEKDGYLIAELGGIRVARRMVDSPVTETNPQDVSFTFEATKTSITIGVVANQFVHELCLLPELVAQNGVTVSEQRVTLLPGEHKEFTIETANIEDTDRIVAALPYIIWSQNRLMSDV